MDTSIIKRAGLTDGEAKVYLGLLRQGESSVGPIVDESGVANSIVYRILDSLIDKGLVSCITREKTRYYLAAAPMHLLDYIEKRKEQLDSDKDIIAKALPQIQALVEPVLASRVELFVGFSGFCTAWEHMYAKLGRGSEYRSWGAYPIQEEKFHSYWKQDHLRRVRSGIGCRLLFNQGTDPKIVENRNSFKGCEARYMPVPMETPAWFVVYKDVTGIFLQRQELVNVRQEVAVLITNQGIADSFEPYFVELWKRSKPFKISHDVRSRRT